MKSQLRKYLEQKDRHTWFYYHLKRDPQYKAEAATLRQQLLIKTLNGDYNPVDSGDFDLLEDPNASAKKELIVAFMDRWNVHWDYALMQFLLDEDENILPPMFKCGFAVGLNKERNMIEAQIPVTVMKSWSISGSCLKGSKRMQALI